MPEHVRAAELATLDQNAGYLGVMLEGKYRESFLKDAGKDAPRFTDEDLRVISSPMDFVGINVYTPSLYVTASDQPPGYRSLRRTSRTRGWNHGGTCLRPSACTGRRGSCSRSGTSRRST